MKNSLLNSVAKAAVSVASLAAIYSFSFSAQAFELVDYSHSAHTKTLSMTLWLDDAEPSCTATLRGAAWPNREFATIPVNRGYSDNPRPESLMYFSYDIPANYASSAKQVQLNCNGVTGSLNETITLAAPPEFDINSQVLIMGDQLRYQAQVFIDNQQADGICTLFSTPVGLNLWSNNMPVSAPFWADYFNANMTIPLIDAPNYIQTAVQCQTKAGTTQHSRVWHIDNGNVELVHDQKSYL